MSKSVNGVRAVCTRRSARRAALLSGASIAALVSGVPPSQAAGPVFRTLSQSLSSRAAAYATAVGGSLAATGAGRQAAQGISNLAAAAARFRTLQAALSASDAASGGASVPDGLVAGGLVPEAGYNQPGAGVWQGVSPTAPVTETVSGGTTTVTVNQALPRAILNWTNFNVGAHTRLVFNQSAGGVGASGWTVLNRVEDPTTSPSQIFGAISAPGQVLILNRNGVLFDAGAEVNLHSLVAGAVTIADSTYLTTGFILPANAMKLTPAFTDASGSVTVQAGAVIATDPPDSATQGGGSVILLGQKVENDGLISTPSGQTILAGGQGFILRAGYAVPTTGAAPAPGTCPSESDCSTVLGAEVEATGAGRAINTGLIVASTGDITLAGQTISQSGGLFATTAVNQRGTVHLLSDVTKIGGTTVLDPDATITLSAGGVIAITPDPNSATASDSQRRDTAELAYGGSNNLPDQAPLPDQPDRSRIEITTAGTVAFAPDSLTLATGGQIAVSAGDGAATKGALYRSAGQIFVAGGATLDVSGLSDVALPMTANEITVNVQGFQLRDAPLDRDSGTLFDSTLTLDARSLAYVAPSIVDDQARDYTAGGLFEVSAEVAAQQRTIGEWSSVGGTVTLAAASVVAQPGATVNVAGGSLAYQSGFLPQSYLIGPGGILYNVNVAPADLLYTGIYDAFTIDHARWQSVDRYINPLLYPTETFEQGYSVGRDAGALALETPTALFEGTIDAGVQTGPFQTQAPTGGVTDPVLLPQNVVPLAGTLSLRGAPSASGTLAISPTAVTVASTTPSVAAALAPGSLVPKDSTNTAVFGAAQLDGLGGLSLAVGPISQTDKKIAGSIAVDAAVALAPGGTVTLAAPVVALDADLTTRSGSVTIETENPVTSLGTLQAFSTIARGTLTVGQGVLIDTQGMFANTTVGAPDPSAAAYLDGGDVTLLSDGGLASGAGSLIDASAGAIYNGALAGGHGGNITLVADDPALATGFSGKGAKLAPVLLDGTERALGVTAGGTFSLAAPAILVGAAPSPATPLQAALPASFFASGFSDYVLNGFAAPGPIPKPLAAGQAEGVVIEPDTQLRLVEPVLTVGPATAAAASGSNPESALTATLNPEFVPDTTTAQVIQRPGASLTLSSTHGIPGQADFLPEEGSGITVGQGSVITADLGQSVSLTSPSQITVDGTIRAPSGTIAIASTATDTNGIDPVGFGRSIWIGPQAVLDVSGEAITAITTNGRPFGLVTGGGSILVGASGDVNAIDNFDTAAAYVFVRPGAVLEANGAAGVLDPFAGTGQPAALGPATALTVASGGGTIAFASDFGIYLDGTMTAQAGGAGALGGELALRLGDPGYGELNDGKTYPDWAFTPHEIVVSQVTTPTVLPADLAPGDGRFAETGGADGQAAISAQQVGAGGFADLFLLARDQITFNGNVSLATGQSITLADFATSETSRSAAVRVAAPTVLLAGASQPDLGAADTSPLLTYTPGSGGGVGNDGRPFSGIAPCIAAAASCTSSNLTVSADAIDIESSASGRGNNALMNGVTFNGASAKFTGETVAKPLDSIGFGQVTLNSAGDLRFIAAPASPSPLAGSVASGLTLLDDALVTEGDLTLDAAQIYPVTGVEAVIGAGVNALKLRDRQQGALADNGLFYGGVLTIGRTTQDAPAAPLSVFGRIDFQAATIDQGGIVEAPLGVVGFGSGSFITASIGASNAQVGTVNLLPGSVTSVSANGLTVPFGGTTDGTSYSYDGQMLAPVGASLGLIGNQSAAVFFQANRVAGAAGSVLDLSGGGTLAGGGGELLSGGTALVSQGFIPGRGGSADTLVTPFLVASGDTVTQPTIATDPIYAILPGYGSGYAPTTALDTSLSYYGSQPGIGEQVTISAGLTGLPAGTYTLLPSYYALLPGAFRVQLNDAGVAAGSLAAPETAQTAVGLGTVAETVTLGTANTQARSYPVLADITTGSAVGEYSTYDQEGFASFAVQNAALFGNARPFLPQDAGDLLLTLSAPAEQARKNGKTPRPGQLPVGFSFAGLTEDTASAGGYGAIVVLQPSAGGNLEILGPGGAAPKGVVSAEASSLDALHPAALIIGDTLQHFTDGSPTAPARDGAGTVTVGAGAVLDADTIFIVGAKQIEIDQGATLSTLGQTASLPNSSSGELFSPGTYALAALSNENFLVTPGSSGNAAITIPGCSAGAACAQTVLASGGSVGLFTPKQLSVGDGVAFGAPTLTLGSSLITLQGADGVASEAQGLVLSQARIDALLAGGQGAGIPAVSSLQLDAGGGLVLDGDVSLDLGASSANTLLLTTPAILGLGKSSDLATIRDGTVVWSGVAGAKLATPSPGTAGTGLGTLAIEADRLVLGLPADAQPQDQTTLPDVVLGFSGVQLDGAVSVSGNNRSMLTVYQSEAADGTATVGTAGNLTITTPLLTTAPGAVLGITTGGSLTLAGTGAAPAGAGGLGGEIDITAASLADDTAVSLPGGRFAVTTTGNITLGGGASIDLAGPAVAIFSQTRGTPGGNALLTSTGGAIDVAAGARIDVSSAAAAAGTIGISAPSGALTLDGTLLGSAPLATEAGSVGLTATSLGDFAALNAALDAGGFFLGRSFEQTGPGDLTVAGTLTAQTIAIAVDHGALTINGTLDAGGADPGTIRLAATGDLTLASSAVLNLAETALHTDYFGQLIAAENTPYAELSVASNVASPGTLTLSPGASILMAGPGGLALGDLEIDVPRGAGNDNANVAAGGPVTVTGAGTIAVNAFRTYTPGQTVAGDTLTGTLTQADLTAIDTESQSFIASAVGNGALTGPLATELAGLAGPNASVFHLRPGVEIDSDAASQNDLTVSGEIDLSEYRYASANPTTALNASVYGSGEPGVLWLRAADDLTVAGSLTDGFLPSGAITIEVGHGKHRHMEMINSASLAPLLSAGDLSWSMRLVAGADLDGADSRAVETSAELAGQATASDPAPGSLVLSDAHKLANSIPGEDISFVRTGTGSLDLLAGADIAEASAFGVYTAGTGIAAAPEAAGHSFATGGGNLLLQAGGNIGGDIFQTPSGQSSDQMSIWLQHDTTSWWLDFASYTKAYGVTGFTGFGALGGGNVTVAAGADAGTGTGAGKTTTSGLQIVDVTTGYQATDGSIASFGGGDVTLAVGQAFNPGAGLGAFGTDDAFGVIADLRGNLRVSAGTIGEILPTYSPLVADPRAYDPFVAESAFSTAGPVLVLGDAGARISARGDLALSGVSGEINVPTKATSSFEFSFYTPNTSLALFSAGGNVDPIGGLPGTNDPVYAVDAIDYETMYYPARFDVTAASGDIYLLGGSTINNLELAPSPSGSLAFLAGGSIFDGQTEIISQLETGSEPLHVEMSGATPGTPSELPSAPIEGAIVKGNTNIVDSATGTLHAGDGDPSVFFALSGDIVGLQTGAITTSNASSGTPAYLGATAVQIEAGRDVVATGGASYLVSGGGTTSAGGTPADFFLDNNPTDLSVIEAGRDVIYANADVAGPGDLLVQAGRNVYQGDQGVLQSVGEIGAALTAATRDSGAGVSVLAGLSGGTDLADFARLYLNPANLANATTPLQDQPGKVVRTYQTQLFAWLQARGYQGDAADALAYFLSLPEPEQTSFLLSVYFAELNQSGLDYNNPASRFYRSYLEGQDAIGALFPATDATGRAPPAGGNLTLFSGETFQLGGNGSQLVTNLYDSGVRTDFGGSIQTVVPYGQTLLGNYGIVPQPSAGVLTEGSGDIDMYSYGSVTLGQSRVLTTFGGNVLIWMSSDGEINAGRGAKNTILVPPVGITYDGYGNIELSPTTPSSGAGIATLAPIPSVPAGDINLIAPFGTIDAGEAGIRSSGNVNVAALTIVNGANIASGGKTTGVPTVSVASVSAVAAASSTAGAATQAAQNTQPERTPVAEPSVVEVDILSIGSGDTNARKRRAL